MLASFRRGWPVPYFMRDAQSAQVQCCGVSLQIFGIILGLAPTSWLTGDRQRGIWRLCLRVMAPDFQCSSRTAFELGVGNWTLRYRTRGEVEQQHYLWDDIGWTLHRHRAPKWRPSPFFAPMMMLLFACVAWFALGATFAYAQTPSPGNTGIVPAALQAAAAPVSIPYGDWIAVVLGWARDGLIALAGLAVARFLPSVVRQYLTNEVLAKAVDYAIAAVDGAEKGKTMTLPVTSAVLTLAERYVVAAAPDLAAKIGPMLRSKLLARVSAATPVAAAVTAASVTAILPGATKSAW